MLANHHDKSGSAQYGLSWGQKLDHLATPCTFSSDIIIGNPHRNRKISDAQELEGENWLLIGMTPLWELLGESVLESVAMVTQPGEYTKNHSALLCVTADCFSHMQICMWD